MSAEKAMTNELSRAIEILGVFEDYMMGEHSVDSATEYIKEQREALRELKPLNEAEPVAKVLLEISGAESAEEALDIFRRERVANVHMAAEDERLREGLRWYAERHHYELPEWDSCSGESKNWLFPPLDCENDNSPSWMVDDGGIARAILNGHSIAPDHEEGDNITIAPNAAPVTHPANATEEGAKKLTFPDDYDCGFKHALEIAMLNGGSAETINALMKEHDTYTPNPGQQECPHCAAVRALAHPLPVDNNAGAEP